MITEKDLQEAIAECHGQRNPTASTCLKLASYYIIRDKMFGDTDNVQVQRVLPYSNAAGAGSVEYFSDTEFAETIYGKPQIEVLKVMDELMTVLQATNPKLYNGVMSKLVS